jgi:hypothetical protein
LRIILHARAVELFILGNISSTRVFSIDFLSIGQLMSFNTIAAKIDYMLEIIWSLFTNFITISTSKGAKKIKALYLLKKIRKVKYSEDQEFVPNPKLIKEHFHIFQEAIRVFILKGV